MLERKGELREVNSRNMQMTITKLDHAYEKSVQSWETLTRTTEVKLDAHAAPSSQSGKGLRLLFTNALNDLRLLSCK